MSNQGAPAGNRSVVVTDIDIPFGRLVLLFVKAGLAAIPAMIAVWIVAAVVMSVIGAVVGVGPWSHNGWMMMR